MRRRIISTIAGALVLALVVPAAALADPAQRVTFYGAWVEGGPGTFSGFPVEDCTAGTTADQPKVGAGWQSEHMLQLVLVKEFYCEDPADSFALLLTVHLQFAPTYENHFTWTVVDATGALAGLRGAGTGTGEEVPDATSGTDTYTGVLKLP